MATLYIYDSLENKKCPFSNIEDCYVYQLNVGQIEGISKKNRLDDAFEFNAIAEELRSSYVDWIASINLDWKKNRLFYKDISLFFISDISCKRTEFFKTFPYVCHGTQLKRLDLKFDKIVLDSVENSFAKLVSSIFPNVSIVKTNIKKSHISIWGIILRQLLFLSSSLLKLLVASFFKSPSLTFKRSFLTRYPIHLDKNLYEDKYGEFIREGDAIIVSLLADGYHQNLSFIKYLKSIFFLHDKKNFIILDSYLSLLAPFKGLFWFGAILIKSRDLLKRKYIFNGIELSDCLRNETLISISRIPRLLMYYGVFSDITKKFNIEEFVFYLHEYPFGRLVNLDLKKNNNAIKTVGFQHGPASERKLLYFISPLEIGHKLNELRDKVLLPDTIYCEDEQSKKIYEMAGYQNIEIMKKVYRLSYLSKVDRTMIKDDFVLVACGLHDGLFLFQNLYEEMVSSNDDFHFKLHPRASSEKIKELIVSCNRSNISIFTGSIIEALSSASKVIVTYSSVGVEARVLGIPVRILNIPGRIDESPLSDQTYKTRSK